MKSRSLLFLLVAGLVGVSASGLRAAGEGDKPSGAPAGLGMTQGKFAMLVISEANAGKYFQGPVTPSKAAGKLADIGLSPDGGWKLDQPLMRKDLESAYKRIMAGKGDGDAGDPGSMTIAALLDKIVERIKKILEEIIAERLPHSPSGWTWP